MKSFRGFAGWQLSMEAVEQVYGITDSFPKQELYGLVSQLRRSAISVPANIAEGHGRDTTKDYLRHLSIARGSLAELETLLILANRLSYLTDDKFRAIMHSLDDISRMLRGL